jgi:hypothetical protein
MGIDRIGGKGGTRGPDEIAGPDEVAGPGTPNKAEGAARAFSVEKPEATATQGVEAAGAATPLAQLQRAEIDLDRYLDLKVEEATHALEGISPADLDQIKKTLKDQLATDPALSSLVAQVTGATGSTPREPA